MRYITKYDEAVILRNDGSIALTPEGDDIKFFNRELIVGDPFTKATAADQIDWTEQTDKTKSIMTIYPTDLAGATTKREEMCGLGTLNPYSFKQGKYFESPYIKVGDKAVAATKGLVYRVITSEVTYNGVVYGPNDVFITDGTVTEVKSDDADAVIALEMPLYELRITEDKAYTKALFKEAHMATGQESSDYWKHDGGFKPRNKMGDPALDANADISGPDGWGHIQN